jgi:hypothetical protein
VPVYGVSLKQHAAGSVVCREKSLSLFTPFEYAKLKKREIPAPDIH